MVDTERSDVVGETDWPLEEDDGNVHHRNGALTEVRVGDHSSHTNFNSGQLHW